MYLNTYWWVINYMLWEIILPAAGASVPLAVYAWKKDTEKKKELETTYNPILERTDLKQAALSHYMKEMESVRGGIRTYLKKRELRQKMIEKGLSNISGSIETCQRFLE